jgi:hypothetical protein
VHCYAYRRERACAVRRHSAHAVVTGLLDRSVLYGVRAEIEGLGPDVLEVCQLTRAANHQDQVTPAHRNDRQFPAYRSALRQVPLGHHLPRHVFARAWAAEDITDAELRGESAFGHRPR